MDQTPEVIRQQMQVTRASLTDKLEALENKVVGTVEGATSAVTDTVNCVKDAVQDTVQSVKGSLHETVDTVKESVNIAHHVERHPWLMFGASVATGYIGGALLFNAAPSRRSARGVRHPGEWGAGPARLGGAASAETFVAHEGNGHHRESYRAEAKPDQTFLSGLTEKFGPEIDKLKSMAIGTLFGFGRELLARSVPGPISSQLTNLVDDVTRKLGGEPVRGPLLSDDRPAGYARAGV
ncbi:MAG TPA: hypothetical protein VL371_01735 [Gemmataceae bacterium]|jgi:hypothetical protein|nr:hypothetical protein [Gemmataceae bacterium]